MVRMSSRMLTDVSDHDYNKSNIKTVERGRRIFMCSCPKALGRPDSTCAFWPCSTIDPAFWQYKGKALLDGQSGQSMNSNFKKKARESWDGSGKTSRMSCVGHWLETNDCLINQGRAHYAQCHAVASGIKTSMSWRRGFFKGGLETRHV